MSFFPGKENGHHALKSVNSASNPYLPTPGDSIDSSNYNPLYVQHGLGFRGFSACDDDGKQPLGGNLQPINEHGTLTALHAPIHHAATASYHSHQGEDEFSI